MLFIFPSPALVGQQPVWHSFCYQWCRAAVLEQSEHWMHPAGWSLRVRYILGTFIHRSTCIFPNCFHQALFVIYANYLPQSFMLCLQFVYLQSLYVRFLKCLPPSSHFMFANCLPPVVCYVCKLFTPSHCMLVCKLFTSSHCMLSLQFSHSIPGKNKRNK